MYRAAAVAAALMLCTPTLAAAERRAVRSDGWQRFSRPGFSVAAPATWIDVTLLTPKLLGGAARGNAAVASLARYAKANRLVKLVLVDVPSVASGYPTNMNVVQAPAGGADLGLATKGAIAELRALGTLVGSPRRASVRLPGGAAVRLRYEARYGGRVLAQTQYYFLHRGTISVLSFTTPRVRRAVEAPLFERSARSFLPR